MANSVLPGGPARRQPAQKPKRRKPAFAAWSAKFLAKLAAASNVSAAARAAGVCTAKAYETRRIDPEFNRAWQQALCEG